MDEPMDSMNKLLNIYQGALHRNVEREKALEVAARNMDWGQVVANGGPPCFHLQEDGTFCGRAQRWAGHGVKDFHEFLPLDELIGLPAETEGEANASR
jgi:hypothetical protein